MYMGRDSDNLIAYSVLVDTALMAFMTEPILPLKDQELSAVVKQAMGAGTDITSTTG